MGQWKLCQAGYSEKIKMADWIDKKYGNTTVDGLCGTENINFLVAN